jgi:hypothetical protein
MSTFDARQLFGLIVSLIGEVKVRTMMARMVNVTLDLAVELQ